MMLGDPSLDMLSASHDTPALLRLTLLRTAAEEFGVRAASSVAEVVLDHRLRDFSLVQFAGRAIERFRANWLFAAIA